MAKPKLTDKNRANLLLEHAFRQFHAPLFFYAKKFVEKEEVAKDLVQDAFLSLLKTNGQFEIENLKAYLFRTVRNNCLNYIKHLSISNEYQEKAKERIQREIQFYDSHETLVEKELQQKLSEAIDELPDKYKTVFQMSRFDDMSNKEIAEKLDISVRTVETQIYRALKLLRESVKNKGVILFSFFSFKKSQFF